MSRLGPDEDSTAGDDRGWWRDWELTIRRRGVTIDRPAGSDHPRYPGWVYPVDYGFVPGTRTLGGDGDDVDAFVGIGDGGLVAVLLTRDPVKRDDEVKLLWNLTESEMAAVTAFLADGGMEVRLVRRSGVR